MGVNVALLAKASGSSLKTLLTRQPALQPCLEALSVRERYSVVGSAEGMFGATLDFGCHDGAYVLRRTGALIESNCKKLINELKMQP